MTPPSESTRPSWWYRGILLVALIVAGGSGGRLFWLHRQLGETRQTNAAEVGRLDAARRQAAAEPETATAGDAGGSEVRLPTSSPYIVISIADRYLWYKRGDSVLFAAPVATGSGRTMVVAGGKRTLRFNTPRGRLTVQRLDSAPAWVPPDWHYQEQAAKRRLGLVQLSRETPLALTDGSRIEVRGTNVVRVSSDGGLSELSASDGREIVADGRIVIPPLGTRQRQYPAVLGVARLYLGDGYGIHGTNVPSSIGQAVSHGCVRMRNEDIAVLYQSVDVGTQVYIY